MSLSKQGGYLISPIELCADYADHLYTSALLSGAYLRGKPHCVYIGSLRVIISPETKRSVACSGQDGRRNCQGVCTCATRTILLYRVRQRITP